MLIPLSLGPIPFFGEFGCLILVEEVFLLPNLVVEPVSNLDTLLTRWLVIYMFVIFDISYLTSSAAIACMSSGWFIFQTTP